MHTNGFSSIRNHHQCLSQLFLIHYIMGLRPIEIFLLFQCWDRFQSSEFDVYRCQILTTEVGYGAVDLFPFCLKFTVPVNNYHTCVRQTHMEPTTFSTHHGKKRAKSTNIITRVYFNLDDLFITSIINNSITNCHHNYNI